jgi:putative redox protein
VTLGVRLLDDLTSLGHGIRLGDLDSAVLIMHDPDDEVVPFDHAVRIREAVGARAALVPIEGGHFLRRPADRRRVADLVSVWATPFVKRAPDPAARDGEEEPARGTVVVRESGTGRLAQTVRAPGLVWRADEPAPSGEAGVGPEPYQLLLSALGACTTMTVRLYADRKGWPLDRATVTLTHDRLHAVDCAECVTREGRIDRIVREIHFDGDLDAAQRERLLEVAERCPVHRTLTSEIVIETDEV